MSNPIEAYPLTWPAGWKRTEGWARTKARFGNKEVGQYGSYQSKLSIADGRDRVLTTLNRMGYNTSVVISSNLALRNDGLPRSAQAEPKDPGVAVYWGSGKSARCMAVDRYDRVADNLGAIAATLEAMRAIERHGGAAILDRAFTGFIALPAPEQPWQVLGVAYTATREEIEAAWRRLASEHHPDRGGDPQQMARINAARDAMLAER